MAIGPDGGLYFCDRGNQRIRRLDLTTKKMTTIAGNGQRGYTGDGGPATAATPTRNTTVPTVNRKPTNRTSQRILEIPSQPFAPKRPAFSSVLQPTRDGSAFPN